MVIEPSGLNDGVYTAAVPTLQIVTEGVGEAAARRAAQRAIVGFVRVAERHGKPIPAADSIVVETTAPIARRGKPTVMATSALKAKPATKKRAPAARSGR